MRELSTYHQVPRHHRGGPAIGSALLAAGLLDTLWGGMHWYRRWQARGAA